MGTTNQKLYQASPGTQSCPNCGSIYIGSRQRCTRCGARLPQSESALGPGDNLDDKYEILGLLGVGGMGEVFKARHIHLETIRCIKVMKQSLLEDEGFKHRFLREAKAATRVHHPNVAVVHDFSALPNGSYYMVSEFIDGITIRQWISRKGRIPWQLAVSLISQVLSGLHHCHTRGLLHRDMSADNIMMTVDFDQHPVAKIIDLGIAKLMEGPASELTHSTQVGLFVGNPKYSSPEQLGQLAEGEELDPRTDIYSLGIVMYEMLLGVPPFYSRTPQGYVMQHLTMKPTPVAEVDSSIKLPEGFEEVVFKALEKDRKNRWPSARELARALRPFLREVTDEELDSFGEAIEAELPSRQLESQMEDATSPALEIAAPSPPLKKTAEVPRPRSEMDEDDDAVPTGTIESYVRYLDENPEGERADEAKKKLDEMSLVARIRDLEGRNDLDGLNEILESEGDRTGIRERLSSAIQNVRSTLANASEKEDWDQAWENGTPEAWARYLAEHAGSSRIEEARRYHAEARDFAAATQDNTEDGWRSFLQSYPEGRHLLEAEIQLGEAKNRRVEVENADWKEAAGMGTPVAWQKFIDKHPGSHRLEVARTRLREAEEFRAASDRNTEPAWRRFLEAWPEGLLLEEATKRLGALHGKVDDAMFAAAQSRGTAEAFRRFLEEHPHSVHASEAKKILDEREAFEKALVAGDPQQWRDYVERWPQGRGIEQARERLARVEEDSALDEAIAEGSSKAFRRFLRTHPDSPVREEVQGFFREALAFERTDTREELEQFIRLYPDGLHAAAARMKLLELSESEELDHARKTDDAESWRHFLETYPASAHGDEARVRIAALEGDQKSAEAIERIPTLEAEHRLAEITSLSRELEGTEAGNLAQAALDRLEERERQQSEEDDWWEAAKVGTAEGWRIYLKIHGSSPRVSQAETMLAEAEAFEAASRERTVDGWKGFIARWPDGAHRLEAERRLDRLTPSNSGAKSETTQPLITPTLERPLRTIIEDVPIRTPFATPFEETESRIPRWIIVAVVVLALAGALVAWLAMRGAKETVTPPPPPPTYLVVDATPWAKVTSVLSESGEEMLPVGEHFTPLVLEVAPGTYRISVENPDVSPHVMSELTTLDLGMRRVVRLRMSDVDLKAYFSEAGW